MEYSRDHGTETGSTSTTTLLANTLMVLTSPGAAQSVLRPHCLLSGFAARRNVGPAER